MSISKFTNIKEQGILSAEQIVQWKKQNKVYNFNSLPKTVILTNRTSYLSRFKKYFFKRIKGLSCESYAINKKYLLCTKFGNGSPAIISLMEELIALNVKEIIFIGYAGILNNTIKEGSIFIINKAYSLTGTSFHYYNNTEIEYSNSLTTIFLNKLKLSKNTILSIDAPFRELPSQIEYFKKKGATLIDMEVASILAFSKYKKINTTCFIITADNLIDDTWKHPKNMKALQKINLDLINDIIKI